MRARLKTVVVRRNIEATLQGYQQKRPWLPGGQGAKPERAARLTNMAKKLRLARFGNVQVRHVWGCFWVEPEPHGFRQFAAGFRPAENAICDCGGALA
jgi:hypothetical protein